MCFTVPLRPLAVPFTMFTMSPNCTCVKHKVQGVTG